MTTKMIALYLRDSGVWKKRGRRAGVDIEVKFSSDAQLRLAQKEAEAVLLSTIDVARLAVEDGLEVVIWGKDSTSYEAMYARADRPGENPRVFKGMRLVHPGWNTRATRIGQVVLAAVWGLNAETDFQVQTAPWRIGPEKLVEKEADVAINAMPFVLKPLHKKKLRRVGKSFATYWGERMGNGRQLGGLFWTAWRSWVSHEDKEARALLSAWAEGMRYAHQRTEEWAQTYLPAAVRGATKDEARFFARWFREERPVYRMPYLSAEDVRDETAFLKLAVAQKLVRAMPKNSLWQMVRP
ncbi:MAG: hypothetical protein ACE5JS_01990 [Nitrospinota bacterium]